MKPEPLNLGELKRIIDNMIERKGIFLLLSERKHLKKEITQRIKSACEFYLRYKDNVGLLFNEHPELFPEKIEFCFPQDEVAIKIENGKMFIKYEDIQSGKYYEDYNEWLFRLVFKVVFEGEE